MCLFQGLMKRMKRGAVKRGRGSAAVGKTAALNRMKSFAPSATKRKGAPKLGPAIQLAMDAVRGTLAKKSGGDEDLNETGGKGIKGSGRQISLAKESPRSDGSGDMGGIDEDSEDEGANEMFRD